MALPANTPAGETSRATALRKLAQQLPVANQQVAAGQAAARDIQLQQAVKAAPQGTGMPVAQQLGTTMAQEAGSQQVERATSQLQQGQELGGLGLGEQQQAAQAQIGGAQSGAREQEISNIQRFADIDQKSKQKLYDAQIQFRKDESGRTLFNETQLMDYAASQAKNEEQFKNYAQNVQLAYDRKISMMQSAHDKLEQRLKAEYAKSKQEQDIELAKELQKAINDIEQKISKDKRKQENNRAIWSATTGIFGTAVRAVTMGG